MNTYQKSILETPVAVLGAGSWGTALAILLAKNGQPVRLWGHHARQIKQMRDEGCNSRYLPDIKFPNNLQLTSHLADALYDVTDVFVVVPSHAFEGLLIKMRPHLMTDARIVWGTKGLTPDGELLHNAAVTVLRKTNERHLAVLSGPSFAGEVAKGLPTAVTIATDDTLFAKSLITRLTNAHFRVYTSQDVVGVEVCGIVKNVLAMAAGVLDGLHLGANALSALITRGLAEMQRLGIALGGKSVTFTGLAGLGDLILSCTDNQSRNRRFGRAIAAGKTLKQAMEEIGQAVEGYYNIAAVFKLAQKQQVEMPITEQMYHVLYENKSPKAAMESLLARKPKNESD